MVLTIFPLEANDDVYRDVEFFNEHKTPKSENNKKDKSLDDDVDSNSSIEKSKAGAEYNIIINELEIAKLKEKEKVQTPRSVRKSRFGWPWGEAKVEEVTETKLETTLRERSKSETGDALKLPVLSTDKSEQSPKPMKGNETAGQPSPTRKGIFRRLMGLFTSNQKNEVENSEKFKLEKVQSKKGEFGAIKTKGQGFKHDVGMSLCKHLLYT